MCVYGGASEFRHGVCGGCGVCVCVCVCVCVWGGGGGGGGKNNIKEGDPYGSRAPVVAWGATKISAAYSACATLHGARRGRS